MGHYASEMNGSSFSSGVNLSKKISERIGALILKEEKIKFKKIDYIRFEWINPYGYTKRIWTEVHFDSQNDGGSGTFCYYDFNKTIVLLNKKEKRIIQKILKKELTSIKI